MLHKTFECVNSYSRWRRRNFFLLWPNQNMYFNINRFCSMDIANITCSWYIALITPTPNSLNFDYSISQEHCGSSKRYPQISLKFWQYIMTSRLHEFVANSQRWKAMSQISLYASNRIFGQLSKDLRRGRRFFISTLVSLTRTTTGVRHKTCS